MLPSKKLRKVDGLILYIDKLIRVMTLGHANGGRALLTICRWLCYFITSHQTKLLNLERLIETLQLKCKLGVHWFEFSRFCPESLYEEQLNGRGLFSIVSAFSKFSLLCIIAVIRSLLKKQKQKSKSVPITTADNTDTQLSWKKSTFNFFLHYHNALTKWYFSAILYMHAGCSLSALWRH